MALCLAWFRFKELADKHNCEAVATVRCQADIKTADTRFKYGGCLQVGAHGHEHIPVPAEVRVVDTTGRVGAFTGAFAVALLEGRSPGYAARFAVSASSIAVTAYGSQPAYPRRDALEALMCGCKNRIG
jgi:sugar/nucleoside kinase (ribokinase family)